MAEGGGTRVQSWPVVVRGVAGAINRGALSLWLKQWFKSPN